MSKLCPQGFLCTLVKINPRFMHARRIFLGIQFMRLRFTSQEKTDWNGDMFVHLIKGIFFRLRVKACKSELRQIFEELNWKYFLKIEVGKTFEFISQLTFSIISSKNFFHAYYLTCLSILKIFTKYY